MRFVVASLGALFLMAAAAAQVDYVVSVSEEPSALNVTLSFDAIGSTTAVRMPNWAPGSYALRDNYLAVKDLKVMVGRAEVTPTQDKDRWAIAARPGDRVTVSYSLPATLDATRVIHWSGPSSYLYVEGRTQEPCTLRINTPSGWKVAIGLDDPRGREPYHASTYDVLADNPVSIGDLMIDEYIARGTRHQIVMRGAARDFVDRRAMVAACKRISETQIDFFRGSPMTKYVWHFNVNDRHDGAGGLEHLSSTQISFGAGMQNGAVGVFSHEYFHLWNVKRIRSRVLGPFDYTQLPVTGALWWLEGVTDYYAHLLLSRAEQHTESDFYGQLERNLAAVERNESYNTVGPDESSRRVGETNNGRGNSNGFGLSYYNLGFLAGFCLDIEIREKSGNRYSLDDVTHALWDMNRDDKPGFEEGEIRRQCIRFGGPTMGAFYDKLIMSPGPQPIGDQLAKIGLELVTKSVPTADYGFTYAAAPALNGLRVSQINGPATGLLEDGELIVSINGSPTDMGTTYELVEAYQAITDSIPLMGSVELRVKNAAGEVRTVSYDSGVRFVDRRVIDRKSGSTFSQIRLRDAWMRGITGR
ncbi:MAG: M61 family metallopeptidase [Fimbriimonadaceae bacterium]|nr:M61 family metallopeptidase [Fimbriimonadaceae bacterium]